MKELVSVVIVNWHSSGHLRALLPSLAIQTYQNLEVIIVNNSPEEDLSDLASTLGSIPLEIVSPEENTGFARGNNIGIKRARGDYLLLLNPDTRLERDSIEQLEAGLTRHGADAACPKLLLLEEPKVIDRIYDGYRRDGLAVTVGRGELDVGQYDETREVFGVPGAAAMFTRRYFDQVGLFEESLLAYYEDVDLNLRARFAEKKIWYIPQAVVYHQGGASTGSRFNPTTIYYSTRNMLWISRFRWPEDWPNKFVRRFRLLLMLSVWHLLRTGQFFPFVRGVYAGMWKLPERAIQRLQWSEQARNNVLQGLEQSEAEEKIWRSRRNKQKGSR